MQCIKDNLPTAKHRDYDGRTAITVLIDSGSNDSDIMTMLLLDSLPINPLTEELVPPEAHDYAWTRVVQYEKFEPCIKHVLMAFPSVGPNLAKVEDKEGREAVHIASPKCKKAILSCIYFYRRYEIITLSQPHYQTKTSLVHLAIDHESNEVNKMVALKFMRHRDHFLRETEVRSAGGFNDEFVINAIRVHDSDKDPRFREEIYAKGVTQFPYCLVMPVGERNLGDVMVKEHIAGRDWAEIKVMMTQIGACVAHMHEKGFIHGDLKPLNIMRVAAKMKLIDLDSACECTSGKTPAGLKFSSAFVPPEMVYVDGKTACVRSESLMHSNTGSDADSEEEREEGDDDQLHAASRRGSVSESNNPRRMTHVNSRASFDGQADVAASASRSKRLLQTQPKLDFELVPAHPAHDLWALGVVFYQIACNVSLFLCDGDGNVGEADLRVLAEWSDATKSEKLAKIKNPLARNMLSIMLNRDPKRRPTVATILRHPFLSFHRATKPNIVVGGETLTQDFDVFISYRVATDLPHVELLHRLLQNAGMKVMPPCHRPRPDPPRPPSSSPHPRRDEGAAALLPPLPPMLYLCLSARGVLRCGGISRVWKCSPSPITHACPRLLCVLGVVGQDKSRARRAVGHRGLQRNAQEQDLHPVGLPWRPAGTAFTTLFSSIHAHRQPTPGTTSSFFFFFFFFFTTDRSSFLATNRCAAHGHAGHGLCVRQHVPRVCPRLGAARTLLVGQNLPAHVGRQGRRHGQVRAVHIPWGEPVLPDQVAGSGGRERGRQAARAFGRHGARHALGGCDDGDGCAGGRDEVPRRVHRRRPRGRTQSHHRE